MVLESHPVNYRLGIYEKLAGNTYVDLDVVFLRDSLNGHTFPGSKKRINKISKLNFPHKYLRGKDVISYFVKNRPDAIIVYGYQSWVNVATMLTARALGIPVIFRDEIDFIDYSSPFIKNIKKIILPILFKIPSAFFYSYTRSKDFYVSNKVRKEKLFFHPCAVDNEYFQKRASSEQSLKKTLKNKYELPHRSKVLLYVGRLDERKRVMDIARAYCKLVNKKNTYLVYVGSGPKESDIKKFAKRNDLLNILTFGSMDRSELHKFYSIADIFIIPSDYDPSPKAMNEAMNFSLPIITSKNVGTAKDLVKNGKNGYVVSVGDISQMAKKIEQVLSNPKLKKKMGKESLKIVSGWNFSEDVRATLKALDYLYRNEKIKDPKY